MNQDECKDIFVDELKRFIDRLNQLDATLPYERLPNKSVPVQLWRLELVNTCLEMRRTIGRLESK